MRSILDFIRAVVAAAATCVYVFVRESGRLVGRWVRMLQPSVPRLEPPMSLEQMVRGDAASQHRPSDDHVYRAIVELASALAAGNEPRAEAAGLVDDDLHEWLSLLSPTELDMVSRLPPTVLRAHLTGRARVPALLRLSRAEMIERAEVLRRRLQAEDDAAFQTGPILAM